MLRYITFIIMTFHAANSLANPPLKKDRPNILLIVADDLGFGDIGAFGSEIQTPTLDSLAAQGGRLTSFYTQASCSPTRSMLLTGVDNHLNGLGTMAELLKPHHQDRPGYEGYLNQNVVTVARLLQDAGYYTALAGKWHLGYGPNADPANRGFQDTYTMLNGAGNHYNSGGPNGKHPKASYTRNGKPVERPEGIFSTDLYTDIALDQIQTAYKEGKPFFSYLAYTAPHFPLQAPRETIEKYAHVYDIGWDQLREDRFLRMKKLGLVDRDQTLPPMDNVPAWDRLSPEEQQYEARKMAIYAAMVDNLDTNIARLVQALKDTGEYDNTIIIFMSDNGTDPYDRLQRPIFRDWVARNYNNSYDNIGNGNSYVFYGPGWAQAGSVLHKYYKFLPSEGGMHVPAIMRIPGGLDDGRTLDAFMSVLDITPTLLDIAGAQHPGKTYKGRKIHVPTGHTLLPYLTGKTDVVYQRDEPVAFELFGHASVFAGPWKAVKLQKPWGNGDWSLYNLAEDPGEQTNVSNRHADKLEILLTAFEGYSIRNGIVAERNLTAFPQKPDYLNSHEKAKEASQTP